MGSGCKTWRREREPDAAARRPRSRRAAAAELDHRPTVTGGSTCPPRPSAATGRCGPGSGQDEREVARRPRLRPAGLRATPSPPAAWLLVEPRRATRRRSSSCGRRRPAAGTAWLPTRNAAGLIVSGTGLRTAAPRAAVRRRRPTRAIDEGRPMSLRPDLVECWLFRVAAAVGPGRRPPRCGAPRDPAHPPVGDADLPGPVAVRDGRRRARRARADGRDPRGGGGDGLRGAATSRRWYDLDQVAPFFDEGVDGVVVSADLRGPRPARRATARVSHEHDGDALGPGGRGAGAGDLALVRRVGAPRRATCSSTRRSPAGSRWTPTAGGSPVRPRARRSARPSAPLDCAPPAGRGPLERDDALTETLANRRIFRSKLDTIRTDLRVRGRLARARARTPSTPTTSSSRQSFCGIDLEHPGARRGHGRRRRRAAVGRAGAPRRARDPQPRGRPGPLRRPVRGPRADRRRARRRRSRTSSPRPTRRRSARS